MKNSLRRYNKAHNLNIEVEYEPFLDENGVEKLLVRCRNGAICPVAANQATSGILANF